MDIVATFIPAPGRAPAQELNRPPVGATIVELRADLFGPDVTLAPLLSACPLPAIVTLRSTSEGGEGPDDPAERRRFFERTAALPAALFDLEAARDHDLVGSVMPGERVILSAHFPAGIPENLEERAAAMLASGTRFIKLVATATSLAGVVAVLRLAQALDRGPRASRRAAVFAAGEAGRATRLLGPLFGAPMAYTAWDAKRPGAAGQYTTEEIIALIGHLRERPRRLYAVVGSQLRCSLSPYMHAAAYRALGLPNVFVPLEVGDEAELPTLLRPSGESCLEATSLPVGGFAVTMPWKLAASRLCTVLAPRAARAAAVNTVLPRPGKVLGDCTDIDGVTRVLAEEGPDLAGSFALVLGAGGAARAATVALQLAGARVGIVARDPARARSVAAKLGAVAAETEASARAAVVVNATPAGEDGSASPWLEALRLPPGRVVVDLPYGPTPTFLHQLAGRRGWRFVGGREVLLYQAVSQFAAMTGVAPPVRVMAEALGLEEAQG